MKTYKSNTIIIGSGAAGYTAAIYAARANMKPILVNGQQPGGQMTITTDVENYPGFKDVIQGPWLMDQMKAQAENVGTKIINDTISECNFKSKPFKLVGDSRNVYNGKTIIIATGATARWLGIKSEEKYKGYGVSACATCDGFFFKNKIVAVIGGGNTAVEEALYLTLHAKKVFLIHRRDKLRAEKILQERLFKNKKIEVIWNSVVEEINGDENPKKVTGIKILNKKVNKSKLINLNGIFIAIGHDPATNIFKNKIKLDKEGYILTKPGSTQTNIPGIFAAGDVADKIYRQAVTAAGMGCMAALDAEKYTAE
ncbi:MAG: Thioredoxin reductase [Alphaproteobacteria bacterium MarineAlpha6_Bin4]|nr:MAG: Thioredoxin reductase [Alphaproteobacteria bacterium MarineAlpha6_Bin4]|tara:strand:- start:17111 stop:18046 length:936 start_codon:yes stop_codon:yes gene_type:complete